MPTTYDVAYYQQVYPGTFGRGTGDEPSALGLPSHCLVERGTVAAETPLAACEALFATHNRDERPMGFAVCSMSMGDIVTVAAPGEGPVAYACAMQGFTPDPGWRPPADAGMVGLLLLMAGLARVPTLAIQASHETVDADALEHALRGLVAVVDRLRNPER
jgi:hypothetical protein